jgi:hypothetical protein
MNSAASVERRIAEMLADEAFVRAPEGTLATVLSRVDGLPQRRRSWPMSWPSASRREIRARWIIGLAAALLVAGIVIAGALLLRTSDPLRDTSSLVIVERHTFTEGAPPTPVGVLAVAPDGTQRTLMTIQPDQLEGPYSEWYAGLSADGYLVVPTTTSGGASVPAVLDLRDPTARSVTPDAEGAMPKIGPDGRLAMSQNDGRIAIFDPASRTTTWVATSGVSMLERDFGPVWTVDAGLLTLSPPPGADGVVRLVQLDPRTMATSPGARPYYAGLGARRVDAAGRLLRCDVQTDDVCEGLVTLRAIDGTAMPIVWTQDDPALRVIDYAWAMDGGVWILTETAGAGPRTVVLDHVDPKGVSTKITTFSGSADDPDPSSYSSGGRFAAFSTDDARIVIELTGQPFSTLWSVDPRSASSTRLPDGIVAGWLAPTGLTSPRRTIDRAPDLPADLRGTWARDGVVVEFRRRVVLVRSGGSVGSDATANVRPDGVLEIQGQAGRCGPAIGTYGWSVDLGSLRLDALDEPCVERGTLLAGTFERAFGYPDTGAATTLPGSTYVAATFQRPFRITMPADRSTTVGSNRALELSLSSTIGGESIRVTIIVPKAGLLDPCPADGSGRVSLEGERDIQSYLGSLADVTFEPAGTVAVGSTDTPLVRPVARDPNGCADLALFWTEGFRPYRMTPGTRLAVVDRGDVEVVILVDADRGSEEAEAWLSELLASIEWLD